MAEGEKGMGETAGRVTPRGNEEPVGKRTSLKVCAVPASAQAFETARRRARRGWRCNDEL